MKKSLIIAGILCLIIVSALVYGSKLNKISNDIKEKTLQEEVRIQDEKEAQVLAFRQRLRAKADSALLYAKEKGLDTKHAFLVDFSLHSGKNRFFVWDYEKDTVLYASLCAHGVGKGSNRSTYTDIKFSNIEGSYCSSLGKYKTGIRSYSQWGINVHYKLHGLEKTNDNAFKRIVVLHSYSLVPQDEIHPMHLPLGYSQGCPVINDEVMRKIDNLLKSKNKPVMLWIYQ